MAYLVEELDTGSPAGKNWRDLHQSPLTTGDCPRYGLCLILQSKKPTIGAIVTSFFCCSRRSQKHDSRVVLLQQTRDDEGEVTKETLFQLCEGSPLECTVKMQGVHTFLKVVLFHGHTNVSLGLLKDLIKPYGPIGMDKLIEVVVRWDMDASLDHEHFQQYVKHGKKLRRGKTLMKFAIEKGQAKLTKKLWSTPESTVCKLDEEENNAFHVAAKLGKKDSMMALFDSMEPESPGSRVSVCSTDGEEHISQLNQSNMLGETPLTLATKEGHFDIVLSLLVAEANPNIGHCITGCTPLQLAAYRGYANIVKALLVFGADMTLKNRYGKTAIDSGAKYPEVMKCFTDFTGAIEAGKKSTTVTYPQGDDITGPFLLCLDGGGMRGLASIVLLREIEDRIRKVDRDFASLSSYFDYIAGTSAGTCISLPMVYKHLAMTDVMKHTFEFKNSIFHLRRPFPEDKVNRTLQKLITEDTVMSAVVEPKVMVLTCKADTSPPTLHIMRNTGEARNGEKGPDELKVWEAIRASSAAPTYFPPYGKFLDGGILANNPTVDCMAEVIDDLVAEKREPRLGMVVSVGTGISPPRKIDEINIRSIKSPADIFAGAVGIKTFIGLILDQMTYAGGSQVARSRAWCTSMKSPYFRLDPTLDEHVDLGEIDEEKLVDLMFEALLYAKRESQQLDALAKILLSRPSRVMI